MTPRSPGRRARDTDQVLAYLHTIIGREPRPALIELRWRHASGMRRSFIAHDQPLAAARTILRLAGTTDVYVGVAPRTRPSGGKDAIDRVWALWADLDNPAARHALDDLPVKPAILIASGSPGHLHAYWPLATPVNAAAAESANRRLAAQLGADQGAVTNAATILRPPATLSHKTTPPTPVTLGRLDTSTTTIAAATDGIAPDPATPKRAPQAPARTASVAAPRAGADPLRGLDPAVYFAVLTGQTVDRSRKVCCPFHEDRTPSLHVYENPQDGWFCFGCRRYGHSVYDLASQMWGLETRGAAFIELRDRLNELFPAQPRRPAVSRSTGATRSDPNRTAAGVIHPSERSRDARPDRHQERSTRALGRGGRVTPDRASRDDDFTPGL